MSVGHLEQLGFPIGGHLEQLPYNLHHVGVCYRAVRDASSAILGEFELHASGDFMRLPEEIHRIPLWSATHVKEALVLGVLAGFTLTCAHYDGVDFERMSEGFPDCYSAEDLDAFAAMASGPAKQFSNALAPSTDA